MSLLTLSAEQAARAVALTRAPGAGAPSRQDPFDILSRYLPTETITLFAAAMAGVASLPKAVPAWGHGRQGWVMYATFAVLTPVLFLALSYIKQREAEIEAGQAPHPFRPHPWPPIASCIAFLVWALSIQGVVNDPQVLKEWGGLIAFSALTVSTVLSLIDRVLGLKRP